MHHVLIKGYTSPCLLSDYCGETTIVANLQRVNLTSPNYPADYPSQLSCTWTITTERGNSIFVQIQDFFTEVHYDYLRIEGRTFYGLQPTLFSLHGKTKVRSMVFNSSSITIGFISDIIVQFKGFFLLLQANLPRNSKYQSFRRV